MPWRVLYESCVSETDPNKLEKLVFQLEDAIVLRYHDLAREPRGPNGPSAPNSPNNAAELQAITRAAQRLIQLKTEKLGLGDRASPPVQIKPVPMQAPMPATMPASINGVKQAPELPKITWRTLVSRTQALVRAIERAWQDWVFKSLK